LYHFLQADTTVGATFRSESKMKIFTLLVLCFVSVALADDFKLINRKEYKNGKEMGSHLTFNIYSENSCSITSVAECGQQLEVITHGRPAEDGISAARKME